MFPERYVNVCFFLHFCTCARANPFPVVHSYFRNFSSDCDEIWYGCYRVTAEWCALHVSIFSTRSRANPADKSIEADKRLRQQNLSFSVSVLFLTTSQSMCARVSQLHWSALLKRSNVFHMFLSQFGVLISKI